MASTTAAKKGIIDYLWEWAGTHGDWGKLLVSFIVTTEKALSAEDRQLIFDHFLDSLRPTATRKMAPIRVSKPVYKPTSKVIELVVMKDVTGVNRLAKNQVLRFSKNVTVIYGENGTGKTGYGRILKTFGFSYDPKNVILPNIFGTTEPKSATIEFTSDGNLTCFSWNGHNTHPELTNISVFNNNCVQLSLSDRQLIVSPIGFHLFSIVTAELTALAGVLKDKIILHSTEIPWLMNLHEGTRQFEFLGSLNAKSPEEQLMELGSYSEANMEELTRKKIELENLNYDLQVTRLESLNTQKTELVGIQEKIKSARQVLSDKQVKDLVDLNARILILEGKTRNGLREITEGRGVQMYDKEEFKHFIQAADNYLKLLDRDTYPEAGDKCLYCQQPLEQSAQELLANYKRLLNDTTQQDKQVLLEQREAILGSVKPVDAGLVFHHPVFGLGEDILPIQPPEVIQYNEQLEKLKHAFEHNLITAETTVDVDYSGVLSFLQERLIKIQEGIAGITESLSSMRETAAGLKAAIAELEDRALLNPKLVEVQKIITNHKIVALLSSKMGEFGTGTLSRKTSEARDLLVQQNFDSIFQRELNALRKSDLPIQLSFATEKGNSKIRQRVKSHYLSDILSEGEQKAIALAEFLTELQLDHIRAPVIFDDPVNSLDHRITDEVAKRLIYLSRTRQTIIFTHSILLLNSLKQQSDLDTNKQEGFKFYSLKNNFGETGILGEVDEMNSFNYYRGKVEAIVNSPKRDSDESKLAAEGYGHLRAAIEISVEHDILQKTIIRYRKGVAFPSLLRVKGAKIDEHKGRLNDLYEKCCVSIDGHSSPSEVHTTPSMGELKIDLSTFMQLRQNFL
jgi:ABC-type lipoprotein export system ATPase subunit